MSTLKNLILIALEEDEEIHGTNNLAELLLTRDRFWLRKKITELQQEGLLDIFRPARPGRGHKNIIRLNRNSPGYPRRS